MWVLNSANVHVLTNFLWLKSTFCFLTYSYLQLHKIYVFVNIFHFVLLYLKATSYVISQSLYLQYWQ
jgi:hypothetical protein